MGNQHPQRMDEGLGQLRSKRFEEFAWHRENTHKHFKLTKENVPQIIIAGLIVPGVTLWWGIWEFNAARKPNLRGYIQEEVPHLYGVGANKQEYFFMRKKPDPRAVPHVYHPNPSDYPQEAPAQH